VAFFLIRRQWLFSSLFFSSPLNLLDSPGFPPGFGFSFHSSPPASSFFSTNSLGCRARQIPHRLWGASGMFPLLPQIQSNRVYLDPPLSHKDHLFLYKFFCQPGDCCAILPPLLSEPSVPLFKGPPVNPLRPSGNFDNRRFQETTLFDAAFFPAIYIAPSVRFLDKHTPWLNRSSVVTFSAREHRESLASPDRPIPPRPHFEIRPRSCILFGPSLGSYPAVARSPYNRLVSPSVFFP